MKYITILLLTLSCFAQQDWTEIGNRKPVGWWDASLAKWSKPFPERETDPATCSPGWTYWNSVTGKVRLCAISPPNTWQDAFGSGSGSTSASGVYTGALNFSTNIAPGVCKVLSYTATGLSAGSILATAPPSGLSPMIRPRFVASAADTVEVQLCNVGDVGITPGNANYSVRNVESLGYLTGSGTIDFTSMTAGQCKTGTVTVAGAAAGDSIAIGWPATLNFGLIVDGRVTAADTVTLYACNQFDSLINPTSATFKVAVTK